MTPTRGDIWTCSLEGATGSEQRGTRPVVVVSTDAFNASLPLVTVVPITTFRRRSKAVYPSEALLPKGAGNLKAESLALGHHVRTVAATRLLRRIGTLPQVVVAALDDALRIHLNLT